MNKRRVTVQYTIRGVPAEVDRALRTRARSEGLSLNEVALEALRASVSAGGAARRHHDLDDLVGTWEEDPAFDAALREQGEVDPALWT